MTAIAATRRTVKELVDGTLRVTVDVEPMHKAAFLLAFPEVDAPIALAPLNYGGNWTEEQIEAFKPKGGPHSQDAARICKDAEFQNFVVMKWPEMHHGEAAAATFVRDRCEIVSRAEFDHNLEAWERFQNLMAEFREWREKQ